MQMDSEPSCLSLNMQVENQIAACGKAPPCQSSGHRGHPPADGFAAGVWSAAEAEAVCASLGPLQRRVVKAVACRACDEMLSITLS